MLIEIEAYDEQDQAEERLMNFLELVGDLMLVSYDINISLSHLCMALGWSRCPGLKAIRLIVVHP